MAFYSASQQFFHIPEILSLLCDELSAKPDLFSAALTSRAFCEPALDKLWRDIEFLDPFIACLPEDLFIWEEESEELTVLYLARPLVPADLERYQSFYAHRVRKFGSFDKSHGVSTSIFSPSAFQAVQLAAGPEHGVLTPRLRSLTWIDTRIKARCKRNPDLLRQIFPMFTLFSGNSLENLFIDYVCYDSDEQDRLRTNATWLTAGKLPNLRRLSIDSGYAQQDDIHLMAYGSWSQLKSLNISTPMSDTRYIAQLASLPCLVYLGVVYEPTETPTQWDRPTPSHNFPSLRGLSVCSEELSDVADFLLHLSPNNCIESLECIASLYAESVDGPQQLLATIAIVCNPDSLTQLSLMEKDIPGQHYDPDHTPDRIDPSDIFKFHKLTKLEVELTPSLWLTPAEVRQIPTAWPNLEILRLDRGTLKIPRIDHEDLIHIVFNCPSLRELGLPFDATKADSSHDPEDILHSLGNGMTPAPLELLLVGHSPINYSTYDLLELLIEEHLPKLERVLADWNLHGHVQERILWDMVEDVVRGIKSPWRR